MWGPSIQTPINWFRFSCLKSFICKREKTEGIHYHHLSDTVKQDGWIIQDRTQQDWNKRKIKDRKNGGAKETYKFQILLDFAGDFKVLLAKSLDGNYSSLVDSDIRINIVVPKFHEITVWRKWYLRTVSILRLGVHDRNVTQDQILGFNLPKKTVQFLFVNPILVDDCRDDSQTND